jgi:Tol biopolymer transport system component
MNLIITAVLLSSIAWCFDSSDINKININYLNQKPPDITPLLFAPEIISTHKNELNCIFTPDGKESFFTEWRRGVNTIMTIKQKNGKWSKRKVASFSGFYSDVDPYISLDGMRLYFSSMRPIDGNKEPKDSDIWYVEKISNTGWSNPIHISSLNSQGEDDYYTSITKDGILYYSKFGDHGSPGDLYRSILLDGVYSKPEKLEYPINSNFNDHDPFIAPDESYLIFTSNRPGGFGRGDLYISFMKPDGDWTTPMNMGSNINSDGYEFCPMLSPDGQYLFFTKNVNGNGDIYWVSSKIIDTYKPNK